MLKFYIRYSYKRNFDIPHHKKSYCQEGCCMLFVLDCHALVQKCLLDAKASVELYMTLIDSLATCQKVITFYIMY